MRYFTLTFILLIFGESLFAQTVERRVLVEHFTNSRCTICAYKNPDLYETIDKYEDAFLHVSYHPPYPYDQCAFYLDNPQENEQRADFYSVFGTPVLYLMGEEVNSASLLPESILDNELGKMTPVQMQVTLDDISRSEGHVVVETNLLQEVDATDLRVLTLLVEGRVQYNAPNGEDVHYNVFRKMISPVDGELIDGANTNSTITHEYDFTIQDNWNEDDLYVIAFVQDLNGKTIFQSASNLDETSTAIRQEPIKEAVGLFPNPASDGIHITAGTAQEIRDIQILDINGKILIRQTRIDAMNQAIDLTQLPGSGVFVIKYRLNNQWYSGKFIRMD